MEKEKEDFVNFSLNQFRKLNNISEELYEVSNIDRDDVIGGVIIEHDAEGVINIDVDTTHALDRKIKDNDNLTSSIKEKVEEQVDDIKNEILNVFYNDEVILSNNDYGYEIINWYEILKEIDEMESFWRQITQTKNPEFMINKLNSYINPETRKMANREYKRSIFKYINKEIENNNWSNKNWIEYLIENTKKLNIEDMWDETHQKIAQQYSITGDVGCKNICMKIQKAVNDENITYSNIRIGFLFDESESKTISRLERLIEIGNYKYYLLPFDSDKNKKNSNSIFKVPISYLSTDVCYESINQALLNERTNPTFKTYYDKFVLKNKIDIKHQQVKKPRVF